MRKERLLRRACESFGKNGGFDPDFLIPDFRFHDANRPSKGVMMPSDENMETAAAVARQVLADLPLGSYNVYIKKRSWWTKNKAKSRIRNLRKMDFDGDELAKLNAIRKANGANCDGMSALAVSYLRDRTNLHVFRVAFNEKRGKDHVVAVLSDRPPPPFETTLNMKSYFDADYWVFCDPWLLQQDPDNGGAYTDETYPADRFGTSMVTVTYPILP